MTRIGKNDQGEIIDIDAPESQITTEDATQPIYTWSDKNIKEARQLLNLRYSDILPGELMQKVRDGAPVSQEEQAQVVGAVTEMMNYLISKYRNDPLQIERVIMQFFKKKK